MLISKEWIAEFISFPKNLTDEEIAQRLSLCTVEVEGIKKEGMEGEWDRIVVGQIVELKPHPNADRLKIAMTRVSPESEPICIVCGGSNLAVGMKVIVALPQSRVRWHGEGELIQLGVTSLRGVESHGMICGASEVGLADRYPARDEREIVDLSALSALPGTPLAEILSTSADSTFDIENKSLSNRPDLWGHRGMAREMGAVLGIPFRDKKIADIPKSSRIPLSVDIENTELCSRYSAVVIQGIHTGPSPEWMQQRLRSCGVRPINVIVDITNYVMLEWGQPMHAFDYDAIKEKDGSVKLHIRNAKKGESLLALDTTEYALSPDMLVVATNRASHAIAGVMGGLVSGIKQETSTIVFESANFNASSIRRASSALRLVSESSRRFEKHLDPEQALCALQRAGELCLDLCEGATVVSKVCDAYPAKEKPTIVTLTADTIASKLGKPIPLSESKKILTRLGFGVTTISAKSLRVTIPSFRRKDVTLPEDIIEEIVRLHGYENIPSALPALTSRMPARDSLVRFQKKVKDRLATRYGMNEVHNYAFVKPSILEACKLEVDSHIRLLNPYSDERPFLSMSLIPNMLETVERNQHSQKRIALFEIARVFHGTAPDAQPIMLALACADIAEQHLFSYMKYVVETLLADLGFQLSLQKPPSQAHWWKSGRAGQIMIGDVAVGTLATVDPIVAAALGIDRKTAVCEINLSLLHSLPSRSHTYLPENPFPSVRRDINLVVDEMVVYEDIHTLLRSAHELVSEVEPFDVYRGAQIGQGKKSISFHLSYSSPLRTLTSEEIDRVHSGVAALAEKKFKATVR